MEHKNFVQRLCIFGLFCFFFILMLKIFSPFFSVLLWAILLYILISPLQKKCLNACNPQKKGYELKRHALAAFFSIAAISLIIGPLAFLGVLFVKQLFSFVQEIETALLQNPQIFSLSELQNAIADFVHTISFGNITLEHFDLYAEFTRLLQTYSSSLFSLGTQIASNVGIFGFSLVLMLFALYFFYLDAPYLADLFSKAVPIDSLQMTALITKFAEITRHLFSGYILVALYQGTVAFILMTIFGVSGSLLFSVILMICSFIPMFGAATVWLPLGIVLCINDSLWKGVLFLALSAVCISFLDNFLRPLFLQDRIKVHPLVIFFSILGGISAFGFNGLILGPIIIILFFTVLDMLTSGEVI